uniref:Uncharacterized protein n=1 Tax=Anguilla anguilla TaxID=7936 RepID=A0A0E9SKD1_ANGAN
MSVTLQLRSRRRKSRLQGNVLSACNRGNHHLNG